MAEELKVRDNLAVIAAMREIGFKYSGWRRDAASAESTKLGWFYPAPKDPANPRSRLAATRYFVASLMAGKLCLTNEGVAGFPEYHAKIKEALERKRLMQK